MAEIKKQRKHEKLLRKPKKLRHSIVCKECGHRINVTPCLRCDDVRGIAVQKDLLEYATNPDKFTEVTSVFRSARNPKVDS